MRASPRLATPAEAAIVAQLLDRFNREYDTPTPGVGALTTRLGGYANRDPGHPGPQLYYSRELQ